MIYLLSMIYLLVSLYSPNSTLLSSICGRIPLLNGTRYLSDTLNFGTFTQDLAQDLDQSARAADFVLSEVSRHDAHITIERVRATLGALGLSGDKSVRKIAELSGAVIAEINLDDICCC